jgi:hypothetical protein
MLALGPRLSALKMNFSSSQASAAPIAADRARRRAEGDVIQLAPSVISLPHTGLFLIAVEVATSRRARRHGLVLR